jgi:hypothetical protein
MSSALESSSMSTGGHIHGRGSGGGQEGVRRGSGEPRGGNRCPPHSRALRCPLVVTYIAFIISTHLLCVSMSADNNNNHANAYAGTSDCFTHVRVLLVSTPSTAAL